VFPSDLPGVNPAILNGMLLYYRLMTEGSGLGDSTELSRVGLSHCGLSGVGAGEEQARKVVAGEASRCGEDK
jgi:hypothetical protein